MRPLMPSKLLGIFWLYLLSASAAHAQPASLAGGVEVPCAVLESFTGRIQILDASRSRVIEGIRGTGVSCGGWVAMENGWAEFRHRDGHRFRVANRTFVQFPETNPDGKKDGDAAVLFRGEVLAETSGGNGELRVSTANALARTRRGAMIVVFNSDSEETQLISLRNSASLENRFAGARKITAHAGEATQLNLRQLRVVPSTPRAIAVASLRPKLDAFRIEEPDQKKIIEVAVSRSERKFAAQLVADEAEEQRKKGGGVTYVSRKLASVETKEAAEKRILAEEQEKRNAAEKRSIEKHLTNRIIAGQAAGGKLVFPKENGEDQAARKARMEHESEKRKLLEELSRIR